MTPERKAHLRTFKRAEIGELLQALDAAERDTARLEWLIQTGYQHNDEFRIYVPRHDEGCNGEWKTPRDAIDAAMQGAKP